MSQLCRESHKVTSLPPSLNLPPTCYTYSWLYIQEERKDLSLTGFFQGRSLKYKIFSFQMKWSSLDRVTSNESYCFVQVFIEQAPNISLIFVLKCSGMSNEFISSNVEELFYFFTSRQLFNINVFVVKLYWLRIQH